MFTGIIEEVGTIESVKTTEAGRELRVRSGYSDLKPGESIALNGVCLTVRDFGEGWFDVAAMTATLNRTTIGSWGPAKRVNLERALKFGDRLGGHLVQGHVDTTMAVSSVENEVDSVLINLDVSSEYEAFIVEHGSIAVDGVSLTVSRSSPGGLQISLIEYTLRHTTLGELKEGDLVNVETDMIGKHVQQMLLPFIEQRFFGTHFPDVSQLH